MEPAPLHQLVIKITKGPVYNFRAAAICMNKQMACPCGALVRLPNQGRGCLIKDLTGHVLGPNQYSVNAHSGVVRD